MENRVTILNKMKERSSFDRTDIQSALKECGYKSSDGATNFAITSMLEAGNIARIGRNKYCIANCLKQYHFQHSDLAKEVATDIAKAHPYLDFRIFELVQLNEFVNHQVAHNIVFVFVENELEEDVFATLWGKHKGSILLKPNVDDLFRYLNEDMIVILKLTTESPKGVSVFWDTRLEKILVDIAVDKLLTKVVYSGEYSTIYRDAVNKYVIDKSTMFRYAKRRGAYKKYKNFLLTKVGLKKEDIEI